MGLITHVDIRQIGTPVLGVLLLLANVCNLAEAGGGDFDAKPPAELPEPWKQESVWRQTSVTREKVCLNGLWRFLPVESLSDNTVPQVGAGWGWFKVPAMWPPLDSANEFLLTADPALNAAQQILLKYLRWAWYKREIAIPKEWNGRRIFVELNDVQSMARIFLNGHAIGTINWPGGRLDITESAKPGSTNELAIFVSADVSPENLLAPPSALSEKKNHPGRGLNGDAFLLSEPAEGGIADFHVHASTRKRRIDFKVDLRDVPAVTFTLHAEIRKGEALVKEFASSPFDGGSDGVVFGCEWTDPVLWDVGSPHIYTATLSLRDTEGRTLDQTFAETFGFREFWIEGRNFMLNGHPVHLRSLVARTVAPADMVSTRTSSTICRRLQQFGFNSLITHNYGYVPGETGYLDSLYRAADNSGILVALSLPNGSDYDWQLKDAEVRARYERLVSYLVKRYKNHPSIVLYAANHNSLTFVGTSAPHRIDGKFTVDDTTSLGGQGDIGYMGNANSMEAIRNKRAEAQNVMVPVVADLDPTRPLYHHAAGNLGDLVTINLYPNWSPPQERSNWVREWASSGIKPLFIVEYGSPHIASFSSYRGPDFIYFAKARQHIWDSEYSAPFLGQDAYRMTLPKIASLIKELSYGHGKEGVDWDVLNRPLSRATTTYQQTQAYFLTRNLKAFRGYGVSGFLPWDQKWFFLPTRPSDRREAEDRWKDISHPGLVPDYREMGWEYIYEERDGVYADTPVSEVLKKYNAPLLGFISGSEDDFTEGGHNFRPGEKIEKQLILINDTSAPVEMDYCWQFSLTDVGGSGVTVVRPGEQARIPINVKIPEKSKLGTATISMEVCFKGVNTQKDTFEVNILPSSKLKLTSESRITVFDPVGDTIRLLETLGVPYERIDSPKQMADISKIEKTTNIFVFGKNALDYFLKSEEPIQSLSEVLALMEKGVNFLFFEQSAKALQYLLGFRIAEVGFHKACIRVPTHPVFHNISEENIRDWRGIADESLQNFPQAKPEPTSDWCGYKNTRAWRVITTGGVASVVIEKPQIGEFLPLADTGFDLQYSPLMEWKQGRGRALFMQFDVSNRSQSEPAAELLCLNAIRYLSQRFPDPVFCSVVYVGGMEGRDLLKSLHIDFSEYQPGSLAPRSVLVVGPGGEIDPADLKAVEKGAVIVGVGLDGTAIHKIMGERVSTFEKKTIPAFIEDFTTPELAGVNNAEFHWHEIPYITALDAKNRSGNDVFGVFPFGLGKVVLIQGGPWLFLDDDKPFLRTTCRRTYYLISRVLSNLNVARNNPLVNLLEMTHQADEKKWLRSYYVDEPVREDDPYRFYGW